MIRVHGLSCGVLWIIYIKLHLMAIWKCNSSPVFKTRCKLHTRGSGPYIDGTATGHDACLSALISIDLHQNLLATAACNNTDLFFSWRHLYVLHPYLLYIVLLSRRIGIFTTHSAAIMTSRVAVLLLMLLLVVGCWSPSNADVGVDGGGNSVKEKVRQERSPVKGEDDSVLSSSVNWPLPWG